MTKQQKQLAGLGGLGVAIVLVLFWQLRPAPQVDTTPQAIKPVLAAGGKKDVEALKTMTQSKDPVVALAAVNMVANVGGAGAIDEYLKDKRPDIRIAAVSGLGSSGNVAALPTLAKTAQDPDRSVRQATIQALNNIDDFKIFDSLIAMLNDPDVNVRRAAHQSIESRIGLMFPDYKAEGGGEQRAAAIAKIKNQVSKMKASFDQKVAYDKRTRVAPK